MGYVGQAIGQSISESAGNFTEALAEIGRRRRREKLNRQRQERWQREFEAEQEARRWRLAQDPNIRFGQPGGPTAGTSAVPFPKADSDQVNYLGDYQGRGVYRRTTNETPTYTVPGLGMDLPATPEGFQKGFRLRQRFYPNMFDGGAGGGSGGADEGGPELPTQNQAQDFMDRHFTGPEGTPLLAPSREMRFTNMLTEGNPAAQDSLQAAYEDAMEALDAPSAEANVPAWATPNTHPEAFREKEGWMGTVQRFLPGGATGYERITDQPGGPEGPRTPSGRNGEGPERRLQGPDSGPRGALSPGAADDLAEGKETRLDTVGQVRRARALIDQLPESVSEAEKRQILREAGATDRQINRILRSGN